MALAMALHQLFEGWERIPCNFILVNPFKSKAKGWRCHFLGVVKWTAQIGNSQWETCSTSQLGLQSQLGLSKKSVLTGWNLSRLNGFRNQTTQAQYQGSESIQPTYAVVWKCTTEENILNRVGPQCKCAMPCAEATMCYKERKLSKLVSSNTSTKVPDKNASQLWLRLPAEWRRCCKYQG